MGKKAEILFQEILVSTAFLGGVWTAIELNPEVVLIEVLGEVLATFAGPEAAASYVAMGRTLLTVGFLFAVLGAFAIGRWLGLGAFGLMWLAGYLIVSGSRAGIALLFIAWGLGAVAILVHTDESLGTPPPRGGYGRL